MKRTAPLLLVALVSGSLSCSSGGESVRLHPVHGHVRWRNHLLDRALVILHPVGDYPETLQRPLAYTNEEGKFTITTTRPGDGAPAGQYRVTVELREKTRTGVEKVKGRNLLPERFSKPETSGLTFEVKEGDNELPLDLPDS
jgi:hypothetical protein